MSEEQNTKKNFSVKQFFKSTAFKCIAVLVVIVLVCGVLLTICNALFKVTDEERLDRVLGSIYPDGQVDEIIYNESHSTELETSYSNGKITAVYLMDDGNYLINASGTGGYGGNVYCWVVVEMNGTTAIEGIGKVAVDRSDGETFLDRITAEDLEWFSDNYEDGENFVATDYSDNTLGTAASAWMTRLAITNSVNTALTFVRTQILDEEEPEPEPVNPFAEFEYIQYIDGQKTKVELAENGTDVVFNIVAVPYTFTGEFKLSVTVNAEGVITAMTVPATPAEGNGSTMGYEDRMDPDVLNGTLYIGKNAQQILALLGGTNKDSFTYEDLVTVPSDQASSDTITSGATYSNFIVTYAAVFAASNYDKGYEMALENSIVYTDYINMDETKVTQSNGTLTYTIVTKPYSPAQAFTITVTVGADKKIASFKIDVNGSTGESFINNMSPDILNDGKLFVGKDAAAMLDMFKTATGTGENGIFVKDDLADEELASGASTPADGAGYSNFLCVYAALFAAGNYDTYIKLAPLDFDYVDYIDVDKTNYSFADGIATYTVVTKAYSPAQSFTITITVGTDKKIASFKIDVNGSTGESFINNMSPDILNEGKLFVGKDAAAMLAMFKTATGTGENGMFVKNDLEDETLASGASTPADGAGYSNFLCVYAALFATANYDLLGGTVA